MPKIALKKHSNISIDLNTAFFKNDINTAISCCQYCTQTNVHAKIFITHISTQEQFLFIVDFSCTMMNCVS